MFTSEQLSVLGANSEAFDDSFVSLLPICGLFYDIGLVVKFKANKLILSSAYSE